MIEVVFSESAAGSLSVAAGKNHIGGVSSAIIMNTEGDSEIPCQDEIEKMLRESEERERLNWENAIPLDVERKDILSFPLALSIGSITEEEIGKQREETLQNLVSFYPDEEKEAAEEMQETARKNLDNLLIRAQEGEAIRVWSSDLPDEACGFCWLVDQLKPIGFENLDITYVELPDYHMMPDKTVVIYSGWGEVAPHQWGHLALLGEKVPANYMHALSFRWEQLKRENATLRAVVNRQLVSVPDTFYDAFILRELEAQEDEFMEAVLIGKVLGKYSLGISDGLIALRIEQFIKEGKLEVITHAKPQDPSYHRMLRKRCSNFEK